MVVAHKIGPAPHEFFFNAWLFPSPALALAVDQKVINDYRLMKKLREVCFYCSSGILEEEGVFFFLHCSEVPPETISNVEKLAIQEGGVVLPDGAARVEIHREVFMRFNELAAENPPDTVFERWNQ